LLSFQKDILIHEKTSRRHHLTLPQSSLMAFSFAGKRKKGAIKIMMPPLFGQPR
jgi:hypothetical protein